MQKSPISTMIEIAVKNSEDAAKRLGKAIKAHEETEKQLSLLSQYRKDYELRFQDSAAKGISTAQYLNYQAFIGKLDGAVEGQKHVVRDAKHKIKMAREQWQESEKKRLSYDTLNNRAITVRQKQEAKLDQKQTDELAARTLFYNKR
ncbi:MAG: flagellar export protein FliJ [Pseudomonadota bacterium]